MPSDREKWLSVGVIKKVPRLHTDEKWSPDMDAYARLRANGLQPKGIDGSAALEKHADTQMEVEMGHLFKDKRERKQAERGMEIAADMGMGLETPPFGTAYPRDGV